MRSLGVFAAALFMTSLAHAGEDAERVVRRSFASDADCFTIRRAACSLDPRGKSRTFSVRVGDAPCGGPSETDATVVVRVERHQVIVEAQSPDEDVTAVVERMAGALESTLTAPSVEPPAKGAWYGWQIILGTLAVDLAGTAGVIGVDAAANGQTAPIVLASVVAVSARVFMGPAIHMLQHEPENAAKSVALELGLPIATALTALGLSALATNGRVDYPLNALALGAAPGAFIATIVDAAAFSTKHVKAKPPATTLGWSIVPAVGPSRAGLDVVAAF